MDVDKRKIVECEAIECPSCERPKRLGECPESLNVGLQEKRVA